MCFLSIPAALTGIYVLATLPTCILSLKAQLAAEMYQEQCLEIQPDGG